MSSTSTGVAKADSVAGSGLPTLGEASGATDKGWWVHGVDCGERWTGNHMPPQRDMPGRKAMSHATKHTLRIHRPLQASTVASPSRCPSVSRTFHQQGISDCCPGWDGLAIFS